ncbi:MAG: hypothetical protein HFE97_04790 [Oscillospiraceae bacterium]|nr:hypothetical protein [Oscillospiraceae bacterium]
MNLERPRPKSWPLAAQDITLTLTANAGILLQFQGHKWLIDGLHTGNSAFSGVPAALLDQIMAGAHPFDGIEGLCFTHLHEDHCLASVLERYRAEHPHTPVYLPPAVGEGVPQEAEGLASALARSGGPVTVLTKPKESISLGPDLTLTAFSFPHSGVEFHDVAHDCLLFSLAGCQVLFMGDAKQDPEGLSGLFSAYDIHTAVINPLFLTMGQGREALALLRPSKLVICHIPFAWEDTMRFREMVVRNTLRWQEQLPPAALLWAPLDTIAL